MVIESLKEKKVISGRHGGRQMFRKQDSKRAELRSCLSNCLIIFLPEHLGCLRPCVTHGAHHQTPKPASPSPSPPIIFMSYQSTQTQIYMLIIFLYYEKLLVLLLINYYYQYSIMKFFKLKVLKNCTVNTICHPLRFCSQYFAICFIVHLFIYLC